MYSNIFPKKYTNGDSNSVVAYSRERGAVATPAAVTATADATATATHLRPGGQHRQGQHNQTRGGPAGAGDDCGDGGDAGSGYSFYWHRGGANEMGTTMRNDPPPPPAHLRDVCQETLPPLPPAPWPLALEEGWDHW